MPRLFTTEKSYVPPNERVALLATLGLQAIASSLLVFGCLQDTRELLAAGLLISIVASFEQCSWVLPSRPHPVSELVSGVQSGLSVFRRGQIEAFGAESREANSPSIDFEPTKPQLIAGILTLLAFAVLLLGQFQSLPLWATLLAVAIWIAQWALTGIELYTAEGEGA